MGGIIANAMRTWDARRSRGEPVLTCPNGHELLEGEAPATGECPVCGTDLVGRAPAHLPNEGEELEGREGDQGAPPDDGREDA